MSESPEPKVTISSSQTALRVPRKRIEGLVAFVAREEAVRIAEVDLAVVDAEEIARLNRRWVGHRGETDVISFDLSDDEAAGALSCQLIVCGDVAVRQAGHRGLKKTHELMLYVVHGLLHLTGWDDRDVRAAARMHARQEELMAKFLHSPAWPGRAARR
jgi:probable rRNA maturation factor